MYLSITNNNNNWKLFLFLNTKALGILEGLPSKRIVGLMPSFWFWNCYYLAHWYFSVTSYPPFHLFKSQGTSLNGIYFHYWNNKSKVLTAPLLFYVSKQEDRSEYLSSSFSSVHYILTDQLKTNKCLRGVKIYSLDRFLLWRPTFTSKTAWERRCTRSLAGYFFFRIFASRIFILVYLLLKDLWTQIWVFPKKRVFTKKFFLILRLLNVILIFARWNFPCSCQNFKWEKMVLYNKLGSFGVMNLRSRPYFSR